MSASSRWRHLGVAAAAPAAALFAIFDLYQWGLAYAGDRFHNDFTFYVAAAKIGLGHGWPSIYDLTLQQAQLDAMGSRITIAELARYISPPPVAWLAVPFTTLPYEPAYWIWSGLLVGALAGTWWLAAPGHGPSRLILLAAAIGWLPVIYALQLGQPGLFIALGVAASYGLLKMNRPLWAGIALGALALKPQLAFLVPLALLFARHDRAFAGSLVSLGLLAALSVIALGTAGVSDYLARLSFAAAVPVNRELTLAYFLGAGPSTRVVQFAIGLGALLLAYRTRGRGVEWLYVCALVGGMLATPYVHLDDLAMLGLAAWMLLRADRSPLTWGYALLAALVIEGEPIWGPVPVLLVELGALALLSVAAFRTQPAPAAPRPQPVHSPHPTTPR
jgi:glycosyl transferase family 87